FVLRRPRPPTSTLFPYTTLFRSSVDIRALRRPAFACFKSGRSKRSSTRPAHCGRAAWEAVAITWKAGMAGSPSMAAAIAVDSRRSEEHTSELQSRFDLVCRLLLE